MTASRTGNGALPRSDSSKVYAPSPPPVSLSHVSRSLPSVPPVVRALALAVLCVAIRFTDVHGGRIENVTVERTTGDGIF